MANLPKEMKALRCVNKFPTPREPMTTSTVWWSMVSGGVDLETILIDINSYTKPEEYGIVTVPLPKLRDNDVLIKVAACGVCGMEISSAKLGCASR